MISQAGGKQCSKCGEMKSLWEFHRHVQRPDGSWRLKTACKACVGTNTSSNRAKRKGIEYKPQSNCDQCGKLKKVLNEGLCLECKPRAKELSEQWRSIREFAAIGLGDWRKALVKANSQAISRLRLRDADACPWRRKFGAILAGLRHRLRDESKKVSTSKRSKKNRTKGGTTDQIAVWMEVFRGECSRIKTLGKTRRRYKDDPWYAKFSSTTRNWRRKLGDGRHQVAVCDARGPMRQVCFDWSGINA